MAKNKLVKGVAIRPRCEAPSESAAGGGPKLRRPDRTYPATHLHLAIDTRGDLEEGQNPLARIRQQEKAGKNLRYVSTKECRGLPGARTHLWWRAPISAAYGSGL